MTKNKNRLGAIGALLDEYERAIFDLKKVIEDISDKDLEYIVDGQTTDENCQSIQSILSHVVSSAYNYAINIHNLKGNNTNRREKTFHLTAQDYVNDLNEVLVFTENGFQEINDSELEQFDNLKKILTPWGQLYDIEQMMEHAIVHILRHRRQIEKFKISFITTNKTLK